MSHLPKSRLRYELCKTPQLLFFRRILKLLGWLGGGGVRMDRARWLAYIVLFMSLSFYYRSVFLSVCFILSLSVAPPLIFLLLPPLLIISHSLAPLKNLWRLSSLSLPLRHSSLYFPLTYPTGTCSCVQVDSRGCRFWRFPLAFHPLWPLLWSDDSSCRFWRLCGLFYRLPEW